MKAIKILSAFCLLVFFFACNKDDVKGKGEISGTLYYRNTLTGIGDSIKIPNTDLFIQFEDRGTSSYLYKVPTDAGAKFIFTNLDKNKNYYIFKTWESDGVKYLLKELHKPDQKDISLVLIPDEAAQSGFQLSVIDSLNTPVSNMKLWVFTNKILADNNDTLGNIFSITTNNYGKAFKLGIQPGNYYINAKDTIGNINLKGKKIVIVPNPGIFKDTFLLKRF
ncbi:MAG: hypothetical protein ABIN74_06120 [Ferruginibacter sp.]